MAIEEIIGPSLAKVVLAFALGFTLYQPVFAQDRVPAEVEPTQTSVEDGERRAIEGIIKDYLLANPEIIRDAMNELERRRDEAAREVQKTAISENATLLFDSPRQVVLGNPNGDATLVEFFDYNCQYCKRAHADMKQLLATDDKLRVVLKEFPVLGEPSVAAARVAAAINIMAPDQYASFHDRLITYEGQVDEKVALDTANDIGLDITKVRTTMESEAVQATIAEAYDLANKLGLTGTPSYVTRLEAIIGAVGYETLQKKIGEARCAAATC